ncbi:glycine hydroxymethyltransferase [Sarracenia purpurea var. burkii]
MSSKRASIEPQGLKLRCSAVQAWGNQSLRVADLDVFTIMEKEKQRQLKGIELIHSENFVCSTVMDALGNCLPNKYSEGVLGARYYGENQYIGKIEMVKKKAQALAFVLLRKTCILVSRDTDNHLLLWDLKTIGLTTWLLCAN